MVNTSYLDTESRRLFERFLQTERMTTLSKLTLHQDQLSLLSNFTEQFSVTVNDFLLLNEQQGYTETPFQLSLLLEAWLHKLEEQKGILPS
jgi:hypothetical protein